MTITFSKGTGRFVALADFDENDALKSAGFRWDPDSRRWWTNNAASARELEIYADEVCREELARWKR